MKKNIKLIPIGIIFCVIIYTWSRFLDDSNVITTRHWVGLILFVLNVIIYFTRFSNGILMTGVYLFLATFNVLTFFPEIEYSSIFMGFGEKKISTPSIQGKSLVLFILYFILNFSIIKEFWNQSR